MGCPDLAVPEIIDLARRGAYDGVELRAVDGTIDLFALPDFAPSRAPATAARFAAAGLRIACLDSSVSIDGALESRDRDEALRNLELAALLDTPLVRVFAGPPSTDTDGLADGLCALGEAAEGFGVRVAVETHGAMSRSRELMSILEGVPERVGVVWDVMHTFRAGETVGESLELVRTRLAHVHLRDAASAGPAHDYVRTGEGMMPIGTVVRALDEVGYAGYLSFEWEKFWHPELEDGREVIPHFATCLREVMA
nr:sugar phosphate isomerase/epimerase family protein [Microbacterium aquimaris]